MQPLPADPTGSLLTIPSFSAANLGRYQVRLSGAIGTVLEWFKVKCSRVGAQRQRGLPEPRFRLGLKRSYRIFETALSGVAELAG
jgi:hypothetical protein